jgi:hypothetical protein
MQQAQSEDLHVTLERLRTDHQIADQRLRDLDAHISLTPEEQVEIVRLKKQKLHLKDEIRTLSARMGHS